MSFFQQNTVSNSQGFGNAPNDVTFPHIDTRAPIDSNDVNYPIGKRWINKANGTYWVLVSFYSTIVNNVDHVNAQWVELNFNGGSPIFSLSDTANAPVYPTLDSDLPLPGNIQFTSNDNSVLITAGLNTMDFEVNGGVAFETVTGNSGGPIAPVAGNINLLTANATPKFVGTIGTETLDFGLTNLLIGSTGSFIFFASGNVGLGQNSLLSLSIGAGNVSIGYQSSKNLNTGSNNVSIGTNSLFLMTGSVQNVAIGHSSLLNLKLSNGSNTAIGYGSLIALNTGASNISIGVTSGSNLTGSESSNILIGSSGVVGDNNTIRIGLSGNGLGLQNRNFQAGIAGVTISNASPVYIDTTTGQLGSIPSFSPLLQTIDISDDFLGVSTISSLNSDLSWFYTSSIWLPGTAEAAHPGILAMPATSGGDSGIYLGTTGSMVTQNIFGAGAMQLNFVFKISPLSNGTDRYILRIGFGDTAGADLVNGAYVEYSDNINSGNWVYKTASSSVRTTVNSTTSVTSGWHNVQVNVNAVGTSIAFLIDGVSLGAAITTNIPTAPLTPFVDVVHDAGTIAVATISVDLFTFYETLTTSR